MMIYLQDVCKITPFQMNFAGIGRVIKGCVRGWGVRLSAISKTHKFKKTQTHNVMDFYINLTLWFYFAIMLSKFLKNQIVRLKAKNKGLKK